MKELLDHADKHDKTIALTASADFGGSKKRLITYYKRFGFVENKGRQKDYEISEGMFRYPSTMKSLSRMGNWHLNEVMLRHPFSVKWPSEVQKALTPEDQARKAFQDHTQPIIDREDKRYIKAKTVLMQRGVDATAFEPGGDFYGLSTNQLLNMLKG